MAAFGEEVIAKVAEAIESLGHDNGGSVDPGVLDSLKNMGEVFDRNVANIKWIAPRRKRVHPPLGPSLACTFNEDLADQVYSVLRQPVRVAGNATINAQTGKTDTVHITRVTALQPLDMGAGGFIGGWTFEQLANMQAVGPLNNASDLAGACPDGEDIDQFLSDVYGQRA